METINQNTTVVGVLPVPLIAEVNRQGGNFVSVALTLPPEKYGRELTSADLTALGATLEEFAVEEVG